MAKVKQIEYPDWAIFEAARLANPQKDRGRSTSNVYSDMAKRWLNMYGGAGRRVNVTGIFDKDKGVYRKSGMKRGFEDVDGILPINLGLSSGEKVGLKVAIEVKVGKDKQSPEQLEREKEVNSAGGVYVFFKTPEQFVCDIHQLVYSRFGVILNPAASTFLGTGLQP